MANTGNIELKLAINHLRLWLVHNNIPYDGLELTIKVPMVGAGQLMQDAFGALLEPEDIQAGAAANPPCLTGARLHFTD